MKEEKKQELDTLTEEQVNYVLEYADAFNALNTWGPVTTPMLVNQRMKDVTLNPMQATETRLKEALSSPKDSESVLQAFSQDFEIQSQPYKRLLSYLGNMLSFDYTYEAINVKKPAEYNSPKYKKDLDILKEFLDNFDYKKEFSIVVQELLRNEAFFGLPRFDGEKHVIQELPSSPEYSMITGRWSYGFVFSFNMNWFIQSGVDINFYPEFMKLAYKKMMETDDTKEYDPSLAPIFRGQSTWARWQDIPVDEGWCFKMNPGVAARVPFFSGLFLDLIQQPLMRELQRNANMSTAHRILVGEIPMLKDTVGSVKDQFSISSKNLGNFLSLVKAAIGESMKTAALPLSNVQGLSFPGENEIYSSYIRTALASSGVNTNLLFTNDLKMNTIETQLSLNVDQQLMTSLYPQFNAYMNYQINKKTSHYKFNFTFEGTSFYNDRQQRLDNQMSLVDRGIILPQKIAAAIGMNPLSFERQMEAAKAMKWVDDLTPVVPGSQMSGDDAGRPKKSSTKISDSGEQTRSDGGNVGRGGK